MIRTIRLFLLMALLAVPCFSIAEQMEDIQEHPSCIYCGMNRHMFAHSRMLISYTGGSEFAACSLHCAALDLANQIDKKPEKIEVGDYATKELIDAEKAVWVIGGTAKGVMTSRPKWAFADQATAKTFVAEHGGKIINFETAIKAAYEDMYHDTMMIRKKRAAKHMRMKEDMHQKQ